jgi:hypothetical protein
MYDDWIKSRRFMLPDEEEIALKDKLRHALYRAEPESGVHTKPSLRYGHLPIECRVVILNYLEVIPQAYMHDILRIKAILSVEDTSILNVHSGTESCYSFGIFTEIDDILHGTYSRLFGRFALYSLSMGIPKGGPASFQQHWFDQMLRECSRKLAVERERLERFELWVTFREQMLDTPCVSLRSTLRRELETWEGLLRQWLSERSDVTAELALSELQRFKHRVPGVEYLGDPSMQVQDVKNMLWEVDKRLLDDVPESYPQSITMRQAMNIGIVDIPWVRGFAWEDRSTTAESLGGSADSSREGSFEFTKSEKFQSFVVKPNDGEAMRQLLNAERDRELAVQLKEEERRKAHEIAANGMSHRIWMSTMPWRPRCTHRFGGCELCASVPIHRVGLHKERMGVCSDIVLCRSCYADVYAEEVNPLAFKSYTWYDVAELIEDPNILRGRVDVDSGATQR